MHVLYEESGSFKSGTVLAETDASLQVEAPHGKRSKVKAAAVLLRFERPSPSELLRVAEQEAQGIDTAFLWECCGEPEFDFQALAREYYGHTPDAAEATAVLLKLHAAPIYFHRKGKGRYRAAPAETLKAALAGQERKRRQQEQIEAWAAELERGVLPEPLGAMLPELLYKPDRNRIETKALELASERSGATALRVLERAGAVPSSRDYHVNRFLLESFPQGAGFPDDVSVCEPQGLPSAEAQAFSLDDASTTEIDDAFSLVELGGGRLRVGVHIAAPGLGFPPGSGVDAIARSRLSTVYMPGDKIPMLPPQVLERFSLEEGALRPVVSLYVDVRESDWTIEREHTVVERIAVAANVRHQQLEGFDAAFLAGTVPEAPYARELYKLWGFALALEGVRGKPSATIDQHDYNFYVEKDAAGAERVRIIRRTRGSPLDKLVAELMILANSRWGRMLDEHGIAAVYRVQGDGKVRMTTSAAAHQGLGISHYAWSSSPLRRYVDLINQWQMLALLKGEAAPFAPGEALLSAVHDFQTTYAAYADFQWRMERYWSLRWLLQEQVRVAGGEVLRDNLVRIDGLPLVTRLHGLPALAPGTPVEFDIEHIDLLELELRSGSAKVKPLS